MSRHKSKRYVAVVEQIERDKQYKLEEAVAIAKKCATAKFDETVELAFKLGVDPRQADQMVRGTVMLPHGTGKQIRIAVFAKGEKEKEAEEAGADFVGSENLVEKVQGGWCDFDVAIATPDMMRSVGKLGRILGPRGLMPNPKSGTVTFDLATTVEEFKKGKVEFRVDKNANIHVPVGKASFPEDHLVANASAVIERIVKSKPASAKGVYLRSVAMSSTMGPGLKLDRQALAEAFGR
jgi:large subunit ribosomal protein L1